MILDYKTLSTNQLFSIWKGFTNGNMVAAMNELWERVDRDGKPDRKGPGKIIYKHGDHLRFTVLLTGHQCGAKSLLLEE